MGLGRGGAEQGRNELGIDGHQPGRAVTALLHVPCHNAFRECSFHCLILSIPSSPCLFPLSALPLLYFFSIPFVHEGPFIQVSNDDNK